MVAGYLTGPHVARASMVDAPTMRGSAEELDGATEGLSPGEATVGLERDAMKGFGGWAS